MNQVQFESYTKKIEKQLRSENKKLLRRAADVVLKEARSILSNPTGDAPKTVTGNLKKGLRKDVRGEYARVGVKAPRGLVDGVKNTAAHAWLVEHGHDVIRDGKSVGRAKPHPFLSTAFENTKERVKAILSEWREL
ncbi:hypothetical protein R80B4_00967 [Fibrobacteres bacterium R8-0-B4]